MFTPRSEFERWSQGIPPDPLQYADPWVRGAGEGFRTDAIGGVGGGAGEGFRTDAIGTTTAMAKVTIGHMGLVRITATAQSSRMLRLQVSWHGM